MADHSLDRQIGIDRLADDINTLKQQLSELRTLQTQGSDALPLQLSPTGTGSVSLPDPGTQVFLFTLSNTDGKRLLGFPNITLYEGSVAAGNEIMRASPRGANYDWRIWCDWGDTDNNDIVCYTWVYNHSGSTQTVLFRGNWRYLVSPGTSAS